jgi:hypothetical protein
MDKKNTQELIDYILYSIHLIEERMHKISESNDLKKMLMA